MTTRAAFQATVHGRVQGVFFRYSTRNTAKELGLSGTVRNLSGGNSVGVFAEGDRRQLEKLADFLKNGPPGARVDQIDIEWQDFTGTFTGFEILS